ncbi:hypothetical protein E7U82_04490 [Escherichia coli]|nr:hypothetical protein [Escherichia coli]MDI4291504.1 hypothetical protein [Escherichia coli]
MGRWWRYKWITFHPSLTPTSILLSMLNLDKDATNGRPFYSRNELIERLVIRDMEINRGNK